MSFKLRLLRIAALLAAAAALPCCSSDGRGATVTIVTIRASVTTPGVQGNGASAQASFSADGLLVAFTSSATNLTPNDANGMADIFIKDRVTGVIENITNPAAGGIPFPGDSANPSLSADGNYVGLLSSGNLQYNSATGYTPDKFRPYLYDRVNKTFVAVLAPGNQFMNDHTYDMCLSADGRFMAFSTPSTNMSGFNTQGKMQVFLVDFGPLHNNPVLTLVSHTSASLTTGSAGGGFLGPACISGDGELVVFDSPGTDILPAQDADAGQDVYLYHRSTQGLTLVSTPSLGNTKMSFFPGISSDGTTIGYIYHDATVPVLVPTFCVLYTVSSGLRKTISDKVKGALGSTPVVLSADGTRVVYGVGTFGQAQQYLFIEGQGNQLLVQSTDGQTTTIATNAPAISGNGRWASWTTTAANLVADDTNGVNDVFLRGPF